MKLDDLEALATKATPGPWSTLDQYLDGDTGPLPIASAWYDYMTMEGGAHYEAAFANAAYIAAANPQAVLALIAEHRALTAERDRLIAERDILRRALCWHGDLQRMATTDERWQQTIDEAIVWVKDNPEPDRLSFSAIRAASIGAGDNGWLPIESAPKDGTRVLLFAPTRALPSAVVVGWFSARGKEWLSEPGMWQRTPSHWRPLPPAPAATDPEGE